ncbi:DMT family transporter [Streptomyces griseocarneus]|uniref:DMT family transporter n=1 Tax=Streptomyces griseocarneus TaxID=51201 RepID=UPI0019A9F152|nr:DMT family transporter [Streptomyces griseocarneus]MBZ6475177.1 DMT family transporter [Streptomyces griseocarneus]GHG61817.1 membrane protein [Streptomyces griseocarneus]
MFGRSTDWVLGIAAGALLALMIHYNSLLAEHTTPTFASWTAHGLGAVVALLLVLLTGARLSRRRRADQEGGERTPARLPRWVYLGGIPGAFTVILAAVTVNGSLSLSGTIAMMLVGQIVFGLVSDHFGLFSSPKRRIVPMDGLVALCVLAGSALIIFGGS